MAHLSHPPTSLPTHDQRANMNVSPTRRFCRGVGSLDNDSDEDLEIDISATASSCGIRITHHAFPSKRQKMNSADGRGPRSSPNVAPNIEPEAAADGNRTPGEASPVEEKKRNQVNQVILKWLNNYRRV